VLCRVLQVSSSGYYDWLKRPLSIHDTKEVILKLEIKAAHKRTRETYGAKRLQEDLASQGIEVGVYRIRRIRKELGLKCKQNKKFKVTTNSNHSLAVADNLLNQDFEVYSPNETWVTDLTYSVPVVRHRTTSMVEMPEIQTSRKEQLNPWTACAVAGMSLSGSDPLPPTG